MDRPWGHQAGGPDREGGSPPPPGDCGGSPPRTLCRHRSSPGSLARGVGKPRQLHPVPPGW
eukprot:11609994-Alexandrium_andersonii.AAC.1